MIESLKWNSLAVLTELLILTRYLEASKCSVIRIRPENRTKTSKTSHLQHLRMIQNVQ